MRHATMPTSCPNPKPMNGNAPRQGYDWRHTPRSGQHRLCPGSLRLRVRQGREIVALHSAYAYGDTAPYAHGVCQRSVCIAAANSLSSAPIPRCTLYPDKSELPCPPVSSCLRLSPTPCASPLIATAPTSGEIGAAEKSKSANGILTFTAAISPHISSVAVHITQRKTRSERSER